MSFLKKLLKSPNRRKKPPQQRAGGKVSEGELRSDGETSRSRSPSRSNSPSPAPSRKLPTISVSAVSSSTSHNTTTIGVRASTSRHVARILPGLLLGSQEISQDLHTLERMKVTHILNITEEVPNTFSERFTYKRINIPDTTKTDITQYFVECFEFIESARACDGCALVHCYYGASRSASVVIAYLMKVERMRYSEALEYLQILRPDVQPNLGFETQLKKYEATVR